MKLQHFTMKSKSGGFKVPTTNDYPATAGPKNGRGRHPAVAVKTCDIDVQALAALVFLLHLRWYLICLRDM